MSEPVIARQKPYFVELKGGRPYAWCSCGLSQNQPFCDGAHNGSTFKPLRYVPERDEAVVLCGCKHSKNPPFCDGSHNDLSDKYEEADVNDHADAELVYYQVVNGHDTMLAPLDNGCYTLRQGEKGRERHGNLVITEVISSRSGSRHLTQYFARIEKGETPVLNFVGSEVVVFCASGAGTITISGRQFTMPPETGVYIREGEKFSIDNSSDSRIVCLVTVCPECEDMQIGGHMPDNFDNDLSARTETYSEEKRDTMADRYLQELVNRDMGCQQVTQFIGEIPMSRAAHHRHLYEEALYILTGSGMMWTDTKKTAVEAGDIVFLPAQQSHSLECTVPEGMRLMGVFYPSGSPKVNY